jgi:hypothetical protein
LLEVSSVGIEQPLILKIFGSASDVYLNQKKWGEPGVDRENLLFFDPYSPEVASIVEFHDEFSGRMKLHAGY